MWQLKINDLCEIRAGTVNIEVLSKKRIPFQIKLTDSDLSNFKKELLLAIRNLTIAENCILYARYGTTLSTNDNYDLENILFYNLGTSKFSNLIKNGLVFTNITQSEIEDKRATWKLSNDYTHYYEYRMIANPTNLPFNVELANFTDLQFPPLRGLTPLTAWNRIRQQQSSVIVKNKINVNQGDTFGLDLILEKPKNQTFYIATNIKPLLDGLICAFHGGNFTEEKQADFANILSCENDYLNNQKLNILGNYPYIQDYKRATNGIKWNPADDKCSFVRIFIKNGNKWALSGQVYKTLACPYCGKAKLVRLMYGMPAWNEEMDREKKEGKIEIMGCCIEDKIYNYRCRWCKRKF